MNRFSLRSLRVLVTVAEAGSIAAAASTLARSQGAISTTIGELEEIIGVQLFVRKPTKGLSLTAVGKMVVLEARGLLAHADEFEAITGALGNALVGDLLVGCFTNLAPVVFGSLVARFTEMFPGIRIHLELGDQEEILTALGNGRIETALMFDLGLSEQYQAVRVAQLPAYAVLPISHELADRSHVSLRDLVGEPMILMDLPHTREYFLSLYHSMGIEPLIKYRSTSFEAVRNMVGNRLGYSVLNLKPVVSITYDGTEIVNIPIKDKIRPLNVVLVTLKSIARRRLVHTFNDFARGYIKEWSAKQS
ncbi:LysR substrate-binding domain-containing protein [Paraburkholderia caribensis]|uniref:LysR substrate-binding domain-containing protein n=1 Tax=Paraburkholderia TaxID=1822464 RepID=UPI001CAFF558|nr:LysR substrate-binding domain-containing protein [Paraburkholderia caribensis]CAG9262450.1 LysR family transcriptional regulator [Paraburkholderia caribensis]